MLPDCASTGSIALVTHNTFPHAMNLIKNDVAYFPDPAVDAQE